MPAPGLDTPFVNNLVDELRSANGKITFKCALCSETSTQKYIINRHIRMMHPGQTRDPAARPPPGKLFQLGSYAPVAASPATSPADPPLIPPAETRPGESSGSQKAADRSEGDFTDSFVDQFITVEEVSKKTARGDYEDTTTYVCQLCSTDGFIRKFTRRMREDVIDHIRTKHEQDLRRHSGEKTGNNNNNSNNSNNNNNNNNNSNNNSNKKERKRSRTSNNTPRSGSGTPASSPLEPGQGKTVGLLSTPSLPNFKIPKKAVELRPPSPGVAQPTEHQHTHSLSSPSSFPSDNSPSQQRQRTSKSSKKRSEAFKKAVSVCPKVAPSASVSATKVAPPAPESPNDSEGDFVTRTDPIELAVVESVPQLPKQSLFDSVMESPNTAESAAVPVGAPVVEPPGMADPPATDVAKETISHGPTDNHRVSVIVRHRPVATVAPLNRTASIQPEVASSLPPSELPEIVWKTFAKVESRCKMEDEVTVGMTEGLTKGMTEGMTKGMTKGLTLDSQPSLDADVSSRTNKRSADVLGESADASPYFKTKQKCDTTTPMSVQPPAANGGATSAVSESSLIIPSSSHSMSPPEGVTVRLSTDVAGPPPSTGLLSANPTVLSIFQSSVVKQETAGSEGSVDSVSERSPQFGSAVARQSTGSAAQFSSPAHQPPVPALGVTATVAEVAAVAAPGAILTRGPDGPRQAKMVSELPSPSTSRGETAAPGEVPGAGRALDVQVKVELPDSVCDPDMGENDGGAVEDEEDIVVMPNAGLINFTEEEWMALQDASHESGIPLRQLLSHFTADLVEECQRDADILLHILGV